MAIKKTLQTAVDSTTTIALKGRHKEDVAKLNQTVEKLEYRLGHEMDLVRAVNNRNHLLASICAATSESLKIERDDLLARVRRIDMRLKGLDIGGDSTQSIVGCPVTQDLDISDELDKEFKAYVKEWVDKQG